MSFGFVKVRAAVALFILASLAFALGGCGGGSSISCKKTACTVTVSWNANHETAVNTAGGGYALFYSTTPGFNLTDPGVSMVDVPYNGSSTPTSASLSLLSGTYYFRVLAYSTLNPPGGSTGSISQPSAQTSLMLP